MAPVAAQVPSEDKNAEQETRGPGTLSGASSLKRTLPMPVSWGRNIWRTLLSLALVTVFQMCKLRVLKTRESEGL